MKVNTTKHLQFDRLERVYEIIDKLGDFGTVIVEKQWEDSLGRPCFRQLTDKGVIIILNADKSLVVTCFIASIQQIKQLFVGKVPVWLLKIAKRNQKL